MFKIALGNKARVGKDTIAKYLMINHGFQRISFAEPLYEIADSIQTILGRVRVKDPDLLQRVGTTLRTVYGPNIFVDNAFGRMKCDKIVITDMRYKNEFVQLKQAGFKTIKVNRKNRPIDRDPNHQSEIELDDMPFDYTINNDGTYEDLEREIERILGEIRA